MKETYLFNNAHWEVGTPKDFGVFFGALLHLVPEGTVLCLGEGNPDEAIEGFLREYALPNPERMPLIEFTSGQYLQINQINLKKLQELASCHAEPEIATHIAVSDTERQILEWFDAPFAPITISLEVPEEEVRRFCSELGVMYEKVDASD